MPLRVLSALDSARTQLYHFTAIFIAGMGFFTDAYDLFYPAWQLFFGWLGDRMGRERAYGFTPSLMVASSIASGFSIGRSPEAVIGSLCFFRFWLGFRICGDYPLSATMMAEYANTTTRGAFIAAVFGMQGLGILAGSAVAVIVSARMKSAVGDKPTFGQKDVVWRIILTLGAVPAGFSYYRRLKMPETTRYTALDARNARQAAVDMSRVLNLDIDEDEADVLGTHSWPPPSGLFSMAFVKRHGLELLGTASTWFFVDIAFYRGNPFQSDIYHNIKWLRCQYTNPLDDIFRFSTVQAMITLCGTLPGYIFTILLIDRLGVVIGKAGHGFFCLPHGMREGHPLALECHLVWTLPAHSAWWSATSVVTPHVGGTLHPRVGGPPPHAQTKLWCSPFCARNTQCRPAMKGYKEK
ncbi:hypothetical protein SUGI_0428680 [Cryptomeria japonica]|nr:hypothetical protein SUGI_0428680 [Cryptomeria japonica]